MKLILKLLAVAGMCSTSLPSMAQGVQPQPGTSVADGGNTIRRLEQLQRELAIKNLETKLHVQDSSLSPGLPPLPGSPGSNLSAGRYSIPSSVMAPPMAKKDEYAVVAITGYNGKLTAEIARGEEHYSIEVDDKLPNGWVVSKISMEGVTVRAKEGKKTTTKILPSDLLYSKPAVLHSAREDGPAAGKKAPADARINDMKISDILSAAQPKSDALPMTSPGSKTTEINYGSNPNGNK